jgi:ATP-dependent protease ClpP protease subunit
VISWFPPPKFGFANAQLVPLRDEIDVCEDTYMGFMAEFSGKTQEQVTKDLNRRHYFTPQEAIEYGFVDHIIKKARLATAFCLPPTQCIHSVKAAWFQP